MVSTHHLNGTTVFARFTTRSPPGRGHRTRRTRGLLSVEHARHVTRRHCCGTRFAANIIVIFLDDVTVAIVIKQQWYDDIAAYPTVGAQHGWRRRWTWSRRSWKTCSFAAVVDVGPSLDTRAGATRPTLGRTSGRSGDAHPLFVLAFGGKRGTRAAAVAKNKEQRCGGDGRGPRDVFRRRDGARAFYHRRQRVYRVPAASPANRARLRHAAKIFTPVRTSRFPAAPSTPSNSALGRSDYSMTSRRHGPTCRRRVHHQATGATYHIFLSLSLSLSVST